MSWKATAWAKETSPHGSISQKFVLLTLADYAHPETQEAWPSVARLAEDCLMSERNVIRCLNALVSAGFIRRLNRGNQRQATHYYLDLAVSCALGSVHDISAHDKLSPAGAHDTQGIEHMTPRVGAHDIAMSHEPSGAVITEPPSKKREGAKPETSITPDFIESMVIEFAPKLGGPDRTRSIIEDALNHKAMDKRKDKHQYLKGWLRRDAESYAARGGPNGRGPQLARTPGGQPAQAPEEWKPGPITAAILAHHREGKNAVGRERLPGPVPPGSHGDLSLKGGPIVPPPQPQPSLPILEESRP